MSTLEDRVFAIVAAGPQQGVRFVDVWLALDEPPHAVFDTLRRLAAAGPLVSTGIGNVERPETPRYRLRRAR